LYIVPDIHRKINSHNKTNHLKNNNSPLSSIKDVLTKNNNSGKNTYNHQYNNKMDDQDVVENSPYKKRDKKTTLPHLNKFNDRNNNQNNNINNNLIQLNNNSNSNNNDQNMNNYNKNSNTNTINAIRTTSKKQYFQNVNSKHNNNYSHSNGNGTGQSTNTPSNNTSNTHNIINMKNEQNAILNKYGNGNPLTKSMNNPYSNMSQNLKNENNTVLHNSNNSINFNQHENPPEKSKVKLKVSFKSKAGNNGGRTKTNQDSCLVKLNGLKVENFNLYSVMDGHGSHGHFVSNSVKAIFTEFIYKQSNYGINNLITNPLSNHFSNNFKNSNNGVNFNQSHLNTIYNKLSTNEYNLIKRCFQHCEATLAKSKYEVNFSGTTAVMVIQIDDILICANAGDSRACIQTKEGIKCLSNDHKPDNDEERKRIVASGGRVDKFNDCGEYIGPYRVWLKYEDYPGLAMSRSLGDFVAKSVGCSCIPEIIELRINPSYEFMIIASDGVWEFLDNEAACKLVQPYFYKNDPEGACTKLIDESARLWRIVSFSFFYKNLKYFYIIFWFLS